MTKSESITAPNAEPSNTVARMRDSMPITPFPLRGPGAGVQFGYTVSLIIDQMNSATMPTTPNIAANPYSMNPLDGSMCASIGDRVTVACTCSQTTPRV